MAHSLAKIGSHILRFRCVNVPEGIAKFSIHGDRNFQVANAPKKLVKLRGDHNGGFLDSLETYRRGIDDFVQKP